MQKWHQLNIACSAALLAAGFLLGTLYGRSPSTPLATAAFVTATRPNSRRLSTAVPLEDERLFGPPLARLQLYERAALFEPAAYRKCACVPSSPNSMLGKTHPEGDWLLKLVAAVAPLMSSVHTPMHFCHAAALRGSSASQ